MGDLTAGQIPKVANVPNGGTAKFQNSDGAGTLGSDTNGKTIYTPDATYGGRVFSVLASTDDTSAVNLFIYILRSSTVIPIGIANMPAGSGNSGSVANVDLIDAAAIKGLPYDSYGKRYIPLKGGDVLKAVPLTAVTSTKSAYVTTIGADYQA